MEKFLFGSLMVITGIVGSYHFALDLIEGFREWSVFLSGI